MISKWEGESRAEVIRFRDQVAEIEVSAVVRLDHLDAPVAVSIGSTVAPKRAEGLAMSLKMFLTPNVVEETRRQNALKAAYTSVPKFLRYTAQMTIAHGFVEPTCATHKCGVLDVLLCSSWAQIIAKLRVIFNGTIHFTHTSRK